jgi:hypothetical protein
MSIGELMNLYESNELDLHPDFQRFFAGQTNKRPTSSSLFSWAFPYRLSSSLSAKMEFGTLSTAYRDFRRFFS